MVYRQWSKIFRINIPRFCLIFTNPSSEDGSFNSTRYTRTSFFSKYFQTMMCLEWTFLKTRYVFEFIQSVFKLWNEDHPSFARYETIIQQKGHPKVPYVPVPQVSKSALRDLSVSLSFLFSSSSSLTFWESEVS